MSALEQLQAELKRLAQVQVTSASQVAQLQQENRDITALLLAATGASAGAGATQLLQQAATAAATAAVAARPKNIFPPRHSEADGLRERRGREGCRSTISNGARQRQLRRMEEEENIRNRMRRR